MKKKIYCLVVLFVGLGQLCHSQSVGIQYDRSLPQAKYAAQQIEESLLEKGYTLKEDKAEYKLKLVVDSLKFASEAYNIAPVGKSITITGGDETGLIYGSLSLVEEVRNGVPLAKIKASNEIPNYPFRAIKFDLPWDTYRHSYSLDQHIETCRDINYWREFLDMMVANRFNALTLWNLHPYTYMIKAKNYPEATPFNDDELKEWQDLHHAIFKMAKERGIDTYLIPFNIFVSPEFAKAHNVAMDNLEHHFFVEGDTSEIIKQYTRESVMQVLQEYPDLTGFGLTLGEGMGGMTPQQREEWMKETIIEGMRMANRKSKLVHRIPFSSTTGSLGITSVETEQLTRKSIEEEGKLDFLEGPVWADLKYNWSHAHSTPKLVKVHGGKLYDTYFKPEPQTYKVTWTARNEDFFCLRWGVPDFVRAHIATNNQSYVGGYFIGSETYIPAKDYFTKIDGPVDWKYAFERQWLFYKLWGRLLYNPETPDAFFRQEFVRRYGKKASPLLEAYALASTTPLRLASSYDFTWDFTLYSEGFMALDNKIKRVEYISVDRQINQPPTDPNYMSVLDYVTTQIAGGTFEAGKVTPPVLAGMLEQDCKKALKLVKGIKVADDNSLMYEVADVKAWANLGMYFSEKLKGAVALQIYRMRGGEENKQNAVKHLENSLKYWDEVIAITEPIYNEMPLVHYSEQRGNTKEEIDQLRFHWVNLRPEVAKDIEIAKSATVISMKSH
ncbi:glycoside hydrolase family 20 zincin-like fold domain-containing protein [Pontibacter harenae]|uniref:glycoside hydrolase family 20 zincin-like fold domain-containing protein n=1 Tax=Pontibacter harenae TaxID=2894083 RepID=UPI001E3169AB|nr:glycoside hydrolase family 20 zincin-like fold domain-containing protein [Pontibacter harenae]MCC9167593.1 glycoside hydrolase family 20 zincin-like fold domain-containing protein [Pontibacter harenae]